MARVFCLPAIVLAPFLLVAGAAAQPVPVASKIVVGFPDGNYKSSVTGAPGSVDAGADVALVTLETGHYATTRAASDGSFSASLFAPRGTSILVKSDPERKFVHTMDEGPAPLINSHLHALISLRGTIVTVAPHSAVDGFAFSAAGIDPMLNGPWIIEGTINRRLFSPGETIEVRGNYTMLAAAVAASANPRLQVGLTVELLAGEDGRASTAWSKFDSAIMTPTGLPIERMPTFGPDYGPLVPLVKEPGRGTATFTTSFTIPSNFRPGTYRPRIGHVIQGATPTPALLTDRRTTFVSTLRGDINLPVIRIGDPAQPRLPALLLMNDLHEGNRGAVALEDRDHYAPANHIAYSSDVTIVPRTDVRTGQPHVYRLEPFTLTMGMSDRGGPPNAPLIPFRFPSGSLRVTMTAPSGVTRTLGPTPFRQWALGGPANPQGHELEGGPHTTDAFELTTLDPSFDITFAEDGKHRIVVEGAIEDRWGGIWGVGGTYEIHVAAPLVIDSAVIPGTPLEVGNSIAPAVQLIPPVAGDVEIRVRHSGTAMSDTTVFGVANRFGWFESPRSLSFADPGEYRIDIVARHRAADGTLRIGSRTWGAVVATPDTPIEAHGRRGIDAQAGEKQQWFFRSQTGDPIGDHVHFPFHRGDVAWLQESDSVIPTITFQDTEGSTAQIVQMLWQEARTPVDIRGIATGEAPLFSANTNKTDPHLAPDRTEAWGYSYQAVERPLVRVRELITEDGNQSYWRFNDRYHIQSGSGANGDLPNDFKFQFGGVVLRGPKFNPARYAIYGSLFVLVPDNDPEGGTRVFPPFQGNVGPDGGPLFTLKGKDIDLFFHPTGVKPGSILIRGQRVSFAGYSAPTLPSKIEIVVTSPSGVTRRIQGQANKIGWFYDPAQDFDVSESGVWKAKVKITFDGRISAGPVTAPFPTGDVLGSREGEFYFYVADGNAAELKFASMPRFVRPAEGPITFTIQPPADLTNARLTYTTTMPGFILEEGATNTLTYTYDAQRLARDFPNLDLTDADGFAGADVITMSFLVSGTDASGTRKHFARQVVLLGEELQMPEQKPGPPRQRVVRR